MMNDVDIKNKRILLFDFDGTLIETASGNTFATDLTDINGWIGRKCEEVKIGIAEDKLIWESK